MRWSALLVLAACGRVGFDARGDAALVEDGSTDAPFAECTAFAATPVPTTGVVTGATALGPSATEGSCSGALTDEDVYQIDVTVPGSRLQIAADDPASENVSLYVRSDCANSASEIVCDTESGVGFQPLITQAVAPGRYFVFVDGRETTDEGAYTAVMRVLLPIGAPCDAANQRDVCGPSLVCSGTCMPASCVGTEVLVGAGPFTRTITTTGLPSMHGGSCGTGGDGGARGPERIYRLDLATSVSDLEVSTDSAMTDFDTLVYIRAGCTGNEVTCDDDSGAQQQTAVANTGFLPAGTYYIFIDGFGPGNGDAAVTITITP